MKDLTHYHFRTMEVFHKFLKNKDNDELFDGLCSIQRHHRSINSITNTKRHIWFRFFSGDALATTIDDIMHTFRNDTKENKQYLTECMQICVDTAEIKIYYS